MAYILDAKENSADQACIFCVKPAENRDEENLCFVMLNKYPYNNGHLMIVPYVHEADLTRLSTEILHEMQSVLNHSIQVIRATMDPHGMNIGLNLGRTAGAGITDHLHYHLVPRWYNCR